MSREQHTNGALQHFCHHRARIASDSLNAFGVKAWLLLAEALIHESHISLLGGQNTWMIYLPKEFDALHFPRTVKRVLLVRSEVVTSILKALPNIHKMTFMFCAPI